MTNPTVSVLHKTQTRSGFNAYPIANGVTLHVGQLVGLVAGYLNTWDDGAASVFAGIVLGDAMGIAPGAAMLGVVPAATGTVIGEARVDESGVTLMHLAAIGGTPTQAKVGDLVYAADGNSLTAITLTAGSLNHPIGYLSKFRSATDSDVTLFTPAEMLAQATA
tara:strand:- start:27118 stop:27609 length:492 start_codon:yes stop_codon:yes gene_type:complete